MCARESLAGVLIVLMGLTAASCGGSSDPPDKPSSSTTSTSAPPTVRTEATTGHADPTVLASGKSDAPLVALVVVTPPERDAAAALAGLEARATDADASVTSNIMTMSGITAQVMDVRNGEGPLVLSRQQGIALDAVSGGRSRVVVLEISGHRSWPSSSCPTARVGRLGCAPRCRC